LAQDGGMSGLHGLVAGGAVRRPLCGPYLSFGDIRDVIVAELAAHMAFLGVARVCTVLGRRRGSMPLR